MTDNSQPIQIEEISSSTHRNDSTNNQILYSNNTTELPVQCNEVNTTFKPIFNDSELERILRGLIDGDGDED